MRRLFDEESIPTSIGFPAETTSEYWAMGAATERERNNEKSLKFVLKRMIGKIKKRQCVLDGLKRSEKVNQSHWNEGGLCSQIF